jgi:hypothetical protein
VPRPRTPVRAVLAGALTGALTGVLAACAAAPAAPPVDDLRAAGPAPSAPLDATPAPACVPAPLERRAAAVLVVGLPGVTSADDPLARSVADLGVGGVFLSHTNVRTAAQVRSLADGLRARAARPLLVSTDEEGGRVAVTRALVGRAPSPRRLGRAVHARRGARHGLLRSGAASRRSASTSTSPRCSTSTPVRRAASSGTGPSAPTRSARRRTAWPSPAGSTTPG